MSLLDALNKMLADERGEEFIDGCKVSDAAAIVDLAIAYSPALEGYIGTKDLEAMMLNPRLIPQPIKPRVDGDRYFVVDAKAGTWHWLTTEQMKLARARFLLLRGYFYKHLGGFSHSDRQSILAWYFEGGVWRPDPNSPLSAALGIVA